MNVVEEKLVKYLEAVSPAMAQILKKETQSFDVVNEGNEGFFSKIKGWMYGRGHCKAKKVELNLYGLLYHGALMKGDAIHDIAAECLIKYFMQAKYVSDEQNKEKDCHFEEKIKESLRGNSEVRHLYNFCDPNIILERLDKHT
jgi:hypothetical protein